MDTSKTSNPNTKQQEDAPVSIIYGTDDDASTVPWFEGLNVTAALQTAGIELKQGETPVIGEAMITDPATTFLQPGQVIVIDVMPANG